MSVKITCDGRLLGPRAPESGGRHGSEIVPAIVRVSVSNGLDHAGGKADQCLACWQKQLELWATGIDAAVGAKPADPSRIY